MLEWLFGQKGPRLAVLEHPKEYKEGRFEAVLYNSFGHDFSGLLSYLRDKDGSSSLSWALTFKG